MHHNEQPPLSCMLHEPIHSTPDRACFACFVTDERAMFDLTPQLRLAIDSLEWESRSPFSYVLPISPSFNFLCFYCWSYQPRRRRRESSQGKKQKPPARPQYLRNILRPRALIKWIDNFRKRRGGILGTAYECRQLLV
jgi:hypothetical protein